MGVPNFVAGAEAVFVSAMPKGVAWTGREA